MKANRCPGCSRHCRLDHVRCKYGQKYLEKVQNAHEKKAAYDENKDAKKQRYKWEKYVLQGGLGWKLLWTAGCSKRALRSGRMTEQELLGALTESEQEQLSILLEKIQNRIR